MFVTACGTRRRYLYSRMGNQRIVPCLWFDDQAEAAASFYEAHFPEGRGLAVASFPRSGPNPANKPPGSVRTVDFSIAGQRFTALSGGPMFRPNPSISFHVRLPDADAVDALHAVLIERGVEAMPLDAYPWSPRHAWAQDRFGVWWQVVPEAVAAWLRSDDEAASDRVFHALMPMRRADVATLERAYRGDGAG